MSGWERVFLFVALLVTIVFTVALWFESKEEKALNHQLDSLRTENNAILRHNDEMLRRALSDTAERVTERIYETRIEIIKEDAEKEFTNAVSNPMSGDSLRRAIYDYHKEVFPQRYGLFARDSSK